MQQVSALPANTLELKDIHIPDQISNYPTAYGWWLLAALVVFIVVIALIKITKVVKQNRVKKKALAQLKNNIQMTNSDIIALLKWATMYYFSRTEVAKLFGESLKIFLTSKLPTKHQQHFAKLSEQAFLNQYRPQSQAEESDSLNEQLNKKTQSNEDLRQAATLWLKHALPPKQLKKTTNIMNKTSNQGVNV